MMARKKKSDWLGMVLWSISDKDEVLVWLEQRPAGRHLVIAVHGRGEQEHRMGGSIAICAEDLEPVKHALSRVFKTVVRHDSIDDEAFEFAVRLGAQPGYNKVQELRIKAILPDRPGVATIRLYTKVEENWHWEQCECVIDVMAIYQIFETLTIGSPWFVNQSTQR